MGHQRRNSQEQVHGHPGTDKALFFDVWSNIHYGYVGTEAGFSERTLIAGQNVPFLSGQALEGDAVAVRVGINLHRNYTPDQLTEEIVRQAILDAIPAFLSKKDNTVVGR